MKAVYASTYYNEAERYSGYLFILSHAMYLLAEFTKILRSHIHLDFQLWFHLCNSKNTRMSFITYLITMIKATRITTHLNIPITELESYLMVEVRPHL